MRIASPVRLLAVLLLAASWATAAPGWTEYRDPQGQYTLSHPNGWTVKPMPQFNMVVVGQSDLCYLALGAEANAERLTAMQFAQQAMAQLQGQVQSKGVRQASAQPDVAGASYEFTSPQGERVEGLLITSTDASMRYAVFYVAPKAQFDPSLAVFCEVVASLRHPQVTIPAAFYRGQEGAVPAPRPVPAPHPQPVPTPAPQPEDAGRQAKHEVILPTGWGIEWTSDDTFRAGDRTDDSATEGMHLDAGRITGQYASPTDTMVTVLTEGARFEKVQTKCLAGDAETAASIAGRLDRGSKVEAELFLAKFTTRGGASCLGLGYAITIVDPSARDEFRILYVYSFASEGRFDGLLPAFRQAAETILAWQGAGNMVPVLARGSMSAIDALGGTQATPDRGRAPSPERTQTHPRGGLVERVSPVRKR